MVALGRSDSFDELQRIVEQVYGTSNDRWFDLSDMGANVSRFTMRAIKAVRRGDIERIERNLAVAFSWFTSSANRLHMQLSEVVWRRFPGTCATCRRCPCHCGVTGGSSAPSPSAHRPRSITEVQQMFAQIYPPEHRTLEHAAIHLVEEMGEYQEAILMYRTRHRQADMRQIETEAADYISCALGLYTSLGVPDGRTDGAATALSSLFTHNCHECGKAPCFCTFDKVMNYNLNDAW